MIYHLAVPAVLPDVNEIRILEWHGALGTAFHSGDLIVELETHKAVVEVRAGQPGILRQISAKAGDWCRIGVNLAIFSDQLDEDTDGNTGNLAVEFEVT